MVSRRKKGKIASNIQGNARDSGWFRGRVQWIVMGSKAEEDRQGLNDVICMSC